MKLFILFLTFVIVFSGCNNDEKILKTQSSSVYIDGAKYFIIMAERGPRLIFHESHEVYLIHSDSGEWFMETKGRRKEIKENSIYLINALGDSEMITLEFFQALKEGI